MLLIEDDAGLRADDDETEATPVETVVPWPGDYDGDRRRASVDPDGLHLLHLTADEHAVIDHLIAARVPVRGVGSRCAHTPMRLSPWVTAGLPVDARPSPVLGGTFLIFPGE